MYVVNETVEWSGGDKPPVTVTYVSPRTHRESHFWQIKKATHWVALAIGRYLRPVSGRHPPGEGYVGLDRTARHVARAEESGVDDGGEM